MSQVGVWQPEANAIPLERTVLERLANCASRLDEPTLGLDADEVVRYSTLMRRPREQWSAAVANIDAATIERLIRFFTVAEDRLPNWEGGAHSPVIALAAALRARDAYPKPLTAWIRAHSQNKFLPWGSLSERL
jgi:hypothetical protein